MKEISCAICDDNSSTKVIYEKNYEIEDLTPSHFDGRFSENIHNPFVKCAKCGLVFANPILEENEIAEFYKESEFNYDEELDNLVFTYSKLMSNTFHLLPAKENFLDIGCGNGFLLGAAKSMGFQNVYGVEPCREAAEKCDPEFRNDITVRLFDKECFGTTQFDLITIFMTLDHIIDINSFFKDCFEKLKPGGCLLCITHDVDCLPHKLLKDKCPIIHIQHINLFNKATLRRISEKNGFSAIEVGSFKNRYSLYYWSKMAPLPQPLKGISEIFLKDTRLGSLNLTCNVGNIFAIAQKGR